VKNFLFIILALISLGAAAYITINYSGIYASGIVFGCGFLFGYFLMNLRLDVKNNKLNSYKRELEKESIVSNESSSKIKVLESKIEVLEKALENALKK